MFSHVQAVVLAAGKATRFKTEKTKLVEKICGQEIILYTTKLLESLAIPTTVVIGFQKELLKTLLIQHHGEKITFTEQLEQRGTGHALTSSRAFWYHDLILVLNGDTPLLTNTVINKLIEEHCSQHATISFVTAHHQEPSASYGRVITNDAGVRIVEANEFTGDSQEHCCINAGVYLINRAFLEEHLDHLTHNKLTNELYITDLIALASSSNKKIVMTSVPFDQIRGINTLQELWTVEQIKRVELIKHWMDRGVRFSAAQSVHIDLNVTIDFGTLIGAGVHLLGNTSIGKNSTVEHYSIVENSIIESESSIKSFCVVQNALIHSKSSIGPFAHIQEGTIVGEETTIGNFVETKRTYFGSHSKVKHLSYIGDATIGRRVNIGAGTITCNFDGVTKHATTIADDAHIGSNNSLVAPVSIGAGAFTAAGSVITQDVPDNALAIARMRQLNKPGYAIKLLKNSKRNKSQQLEP